MGTFSYPNANFSILAFLIDAVAASGTIEAEEDGLRPVDPERVLMIHGGC